MIYNPPVGGGSSDPYVTGNPATSTPGSIPPGAAIEQPQREIMSLILAAGVTPSATDMTQLAQAIQTGSLNIAHAGGSSDAITGSFSRVISTLALGMGMLLVRATAANTTTAPTFTPGSVSPLPIVKGNNQALAVGDIPAAGFWMQLQFDSTNNNWVLLNPANGVRSPKDARAWVTFDGTAGGGILAEYNVASFTRNAMGLYTFGFAAGVFADVDYAAVTSNTSQYGGTSGDYYSVSGPGGAPALKTTTQCQMVFGSGSTAVDVKQGTVAFFGN